MRRSDSDFFADEDAGYLVSVSDIMAGLLFIFIITLVVFVTQFKEAKHEQQAQIEKLTNNDAVRSTLLQHIQSQLAAQGIPVTLNADSGVLILGEDAVPFQLGDRDPTAIGQTHLKTIASVLGQIIPCYTANPPASLHCAADKKGKLDSIFIEGHTDSRPIQRPGYTNWNLSSDRAIESFQIMKAAEPTISGLDNSIGQPLFSVSGYAAERPRADRPDWSSADPRQRRIELRFIMTPPKHAGDVEPKRELEAAGVR